MFKDNKQTAWGKPYFTLEKAELQQLYQRQKSNVANWILEEEVHTIYSVEWLQISTCDTISSGMSSQLSMKEKGTVAGKTGCNLTTDKKECPLKVSF